MYHIYTTPTFIIHSSPYGESGKFLLLFTRDFGMIGVIAQGIRLSKSKLRYHIQDGNFSNVSIIKGKEVWRLTGAHEISYSRNTLLQLKILKLLKRLLHGEEKNEKLFEIIEELYKTDINKKDIEAVEGLTILRILNTLGYIKNNDEIEIFLKDTSLTNSIIEQLRSIQSKIVVTINQALKESQL
jgi:DNA repair protein RecO (recombination protein O)